MSIAILVSLCLTFALTQFFQLGYAANLGSCLKAPKSIMISKAYKIETPQKFG
jgi:hypothetical protein